MEKQERAELKRRVDETGRLAVCEASEMSYGTLGAKLNGFIAITESDVDKINEAIEKIKVGA